MINYPDEKFDGLIVAIEKEGHTLINRDGEWVCSNPVAVQSIIDAYTSQDELIYKAKLELDETDAYFESPRVKEDAMFGIITPEHQVMRDRREALRKIVRGE